MKSEATLVEQSPGRWLLQGELGFNTVSGVLQHAGVKLRQYEQLQVDLEGVTRVDSAGLALLVEWLRESEHAGNDIVFVNVPAQLLSIARVCGLDEILALG